MNTTVLRMGYSATNTARVAAAGGHYDASAGGYVVPVSATAIIAEDLAAHARGVRRADAARSRARDSITTAASLRGYSTREIDTALRTSGGDDL